MRCLAAFLIASACLADSPSRQPFYDRTHESNIFGGARHYRVLLPPGYETSAARYPVIYYFHGHSDRYTVEQYDDGTDTIPKMAAFVSANPVIVVCADGYVAEHYTGFYGGAPYDVWDNDAKIDYGAYFLELVDHIDATYRTLTDRRHRATSGLSMGGFMSLYLSARFPDKIGSASSFNPGPEFFVGDAGRRVLWRPKDHVSNHEQTMVRLIRASGDFISQYHEETREAYARAAAVDFEYRMDEYHKHWATSIGETFAFHMRAFENPALNNVPEVWSYSNPFRAFEVRGYRISLETQEKGIVYLEQVRQGGLRVRTRRWAPDGPPMDATVTIVTAPAYSPGKDYRILDYSLAAGKTRHTTATCGADGRLTLTLDGGGHQIGIAGPGTGATPPVLLPVTAKDRLRVRPGADVPLPVRLFNPRGEPMTGVTAALTTEYPTVQVTGARAEIQAIEPGGVAELSGKLAARFTAGAGYFAPASMKLDLTYDDWHGVSETIDVLVTPEVVPAPTAYEILDGRTMTFTVFHQKGNQGGGGPVKRVVTEGKGNGNGILEPGEEATIWVRMAQGMDPFDKGNWYRAKIYSDSPYIAEIADIQEQKQREWTGAKERTSVIRLASGAPANAAIPLLLENETWSFTFTPDVRYGRERLYQAFQLHTRHLHRIAIGGKRER